MLTWFSANAISLLACLLCLICTVAAVQVVVAANKRKPRRDFGIRPTSPQCDAVTKEYLDAQATIRVSGFEEPTPWTSIGDAK